MTGPAEPPYPALPVQAMLYVTGGQIRVTYAGEYASHTMSSGNMRDVGQKALACWESSGQIPSMHAASVRHGCQQGSRITVWLQSVSMMAMGNSPPRYAGVIQEKKYAQHD